MTTQQTRVGLDRPVGEDRDGLLRLALKLDAAASGALGALLVAAGAALDRPFGIPFALLLPAGLFLLVYAAFAWVVGTRRRINRTAALAIVVVNLFWVADSIALVLAGLLPLTTLGVALILAQAAVVALLPAAQLYGLRRAGRVR